MRLLLLSCLSLIAVACQAQPQMAAQTAPASCHAGVKPDAACTPGAIDPRVTQANIQQTICVPGYTKTVRPPVSVTGPIKVERMTAYGVSGAASYELDHSIPLEVGGAPRDLRNLWPEPWDTAAPDFGAHSKDKVENAAHDAVCAGTMQLSDAQTWLAGDWVALCRQLQVDPSC